MNDWLNKRLGNVGLNAEWWSSAWPLDGAPPDGVYAGHRFIVDNEDGTYDLVARWSQGSGEDDSMTLRTLTTQEEVAEIVRLRGESVELTIRLDGLRHRDLLDLAKGKRKGETPRRLLALAIDAARSAGR